MVCWVGFALYLLTRGWKEERSTGVEAKRRGRESVIDPKNHCQIRFCFLFVLPKNEILAESEFAAPTIIKLIPILFSTLGAFVAYNVNLVADQFQRAFQTKTTNISSQAARKQTGNAGTYEILEQFSSNRLKLAKANPTLSNYK